MNQLPLKPEDVTEFTCDAANWIQHAYLSEYRGIGDPSVDPCAIAAEWAHRIAVERARHASQALNGNMVAQHERDNLGESALAYVAWLDSLKGGQNG